MTDTTCSGDDTTDVGGGLVGGGYGTDIVLSRNTSN